MYTSENQEVRLFPSKTSFVIFWSYISLFVSQGLLVKAVHESNIKGFNSIVIVLFTEFAKLVICIAVHLIKSHGNVKQLVRDLHSNRVLLLYYLVPAFLYCLYNNLTFVNLKLFDLATYYCLMQFRIVLTAIIYQLLFSKRLNRTQWASLVILTLGCLIKEYGMYSIDKATKSNETRANELVNTTAHSITETVDSTTQEKGNLTTRYIFSVSLILIQMFCSCFAGVYNEYLLKDVSSSYNADVILQNMFMYIDSIVCNLVAFRLAPKIGGQSEKRSTGEDHLNATELLHNLLVNPIVVMLIFNNAISGLVASFFLKSLNSILKTFASALELFAITFFAWVIFNDHVDKFTISALLLVTISLKIYSSNPVSTAPPNKTTNFREGFSLLPTQEEE